MIGFYADKMAYKNHDPYKSKQMINKKYKLCCLTYLLFSMFVVNKNAF
jgi:hypothetical protein